MVEDELHRAGFAQVDAYRYNPASLRVRVVDPRFDGQSFARRADLIEPYLDQLPDETRGDIITVFLLTPAEVEQAPTSPRDHDSNDEFENPSPSHL